MDYSLEKPNAQQLVYSLYLALLEREPDLAGFEYHAKRLTRGEITESKLASEFLRSPEFCAKHGSLVEKYAGKEKGFSTVDYYSTSDLEIFSKFDRSGVKPSEGFLTEWIGSRVRLSSLWSSLRHEDFNNKVLPLPIPGDYHADAIEWIGTLKAVLAARDTFSVMELGAGHGPWLAAASAAARTRGILDLHLCGVEADPDRFKLLTQNMVDNQLANVDLTLIEAAVGVTDSVARWPRLSNPRDVAGARPLRIGNQEDEEYLTPLRTEELIDVRITALGPLVKKRPVWDLIHIDIQGTEYDLCQGCLDDLSASARYLVIGTHTRKVEGDLIELFLNAGWHLEHELPCRLRTPFTKASSIGIFDGTQVWRNLRL